MRKVRKVLLAVSALALSMTAASPASAWYIRHYYDANFNDVGWIAFCDNGHIIWNGAGPGAVGYWDEPKEWGEALGWEPIYC